MVALHLWPGEGLISHLWFQNVCIDCSAVPQMDLKEDPEERKEQIYAILDDPKSTSQNGVEMYDKWCKYYDQVNPQNKTRMPLDFARPVRSWTLIPNFFKKQSLTIKIHSN